VRASSERSTLVRPLPASLAFRHLLLFQGIVTSLILRTCLSAEHLRNPGDCLYVCVRVFVRACVECARSSVFECVRSLSMHTNKHPQESLLSKKHRLSLFRASGLFTRACIKLQEHHQELRAHARKRVPIMVACVFGCRHAHTHTHLTELHPLPALRDQKSLSQSV